MFGVIENNFGRPNWVNLKENSIGQQDYVIHKSGLPKQVLPYNDFFLFFIFLLFSFLFLQTWY